LGKRIILYLNNIIIFYRFTISLPIDCTFENGWCNFFQDESADFEWERTNTASVSSNTGPGFGIKTKKTLFFSYLNQLFIL
jgi:hypothetical protein